ncbi:MAG: DNA repair protein RecN [Paludibacteraceae bacterium]|nr:DNA repair protein RecN [Paludibacteraceae bacterium]
MLQHLHIENYALISHLDIDFHDGFAAITGETGAGKSIILGALALVMGGRADTKSITEGEEHCIIEADFGKYLIRRELHQNGRSRSFVNDEVVTQAELKTLAAQLIDIHSQHENLLIDNDDFQLSVVDSIAANTAERTAYTVAYEQYTQANNALNELIAFADKTRKDADYLSFQYEQLAAANLQENEENTLEKEQIRLTNIEELKQNAQLVLNKLDDDEHGASSLIHSCDIGGIDDELEQRLRSVDIELKDIIGELNRLYDNMEEDPQQLQAIEERLDLLNTLMRKHQVSSSAELIAMRDQLEQQVNQIADFDDQIAALRQERDKALQQLDKAGEQLTRSRMAVRESICQQLIRQLGALGIKHANMDISIDALPDFAPSGKDNVQFLFAANLNQSLRRVSEVASGGEVARIMLCIKSLIASTMGLPTIIFDEIDTGVSGEVATQMGKIMRQMATNRQILAITHLPQIAAQATAQYRVYKQDTDQRTETNIQLLTSDQRVAEIAAMLAGNQVTDASLETAKQLLCCH